MDAYRSVCLALSRLFEIELNLVIL
jgi:hypothetical protein